MGSGDCVVPVIMSGVWEARSSTALPFEATNKRRIVSTHFTGSPPLCDRARLQEHRHEIPHLLGLL
jgi:hypothetical protein